jgi:hypothetical protein
VPDFSEQAAAKLAQATQRIIDQIAGHVARAGEGMTRAQLVTLLENTNFNTLINDTLGFKGDLNKLNQDYTNLLKETEKFAPLTPQAVGALVATNKATLIARYNGLFPAQMKDAVVNGVLGGVPRKEIGTFLRTQSGFTSANVKTWVNTSLSTFSRSVTAKMAEAAPPGQKYVYIGDQDDKTRDICVEMGAAEALTQAEIEAQYPGTFIDGGGFNCRHKWSPETPLSKKFTDQSAAAAEQANRQAGIRNGKPSKQAYAPVTPLQKAIADETVS